jgi:predicted GH43/DUF377 family glycosyl hydrolase
MRLPDPGDYILQFDSLSCRAGNTFEVVTNPTLHLYNGPEQQEAVVSAKALSIHIDGPKNNETWTWTMNLVLARIQDPAELATSPLLRCTTFPLFEVGGRWRNKTCQWTFSRQRVSGPGDSRLFDLGGKLFVLFGSRILGLPHECADSRMQDVIYGQFISELAQSPGHISPAGPQFSIASAPVLVDWRPNRHAESLPHREMQKNYSPFVWRDKLYATYSLVPHVVLRIDVDTGKADLAFNTSGDALAPLAHCYPRAVFRGGSEAVLVDLSALNGPNTELQAAYIAVFHFQYPDGHYRHHLYAFEAGPPFALLSFSCELPLRTLPHYMQPNVFPHVAFATGIIILGDRILVSYGSGDSEARIWVGNLSMLRIFSRFRPCPDQDKQKNATMGSK